MANLLTSLRLMLVVPSAMAFARSEFISPPLLLALMSVLAAGRLLAYTCNYLLYAVPC